MLTIRRISEAVDSHEPAHYELHGNTRQAAVAIILRERDETTDALFILRATKEGDPWSGQMAFPGGHREPSDDSVRHAAERETMEEIGLDLTKYGRFIGEIDGVRANPRGRNIDLVVTPFVYELTDHDAVTTPNYEVAEVLWGSLNLMHTGDSLTVGKFVIQGETHRYPGYAVGEQIVWGMTYRMLDQFFGVLDPAWSPRD